MAARYDQRWSNIVRAVEERRVLEGLSWDQLATAADLRPKIAADIQALASGGQVAWFILTSDELERIAQVLGVPLLAIAAPERHVAPAA